MSLGAAERRFLTLAVLELPWEGNAGLDWEAVFARVQRLGLGGLAWKAARATSGGRTEPLRRLALHDAARTQLALQVFARVTHTLRGAGLECMALKGVGLCALDPSYVPLRHVSDLDLLVRPRDVAAVDAALVAAGATRVPGRPTFEGERSPLEAAHPGAAAAGGYVDPSGLQLDLHARPPVAAGAADLDGVWARGRTVSILGTEVRVPAPADALAIASGHALSHHGGDPLMVPRLVADVGRLLELGALAGAPAPSGDVALALELRREAVTAARASRPWPSALERSLSPGWARLEGGLLALRYKAVVRARLLRERGWAAVFPSRAYLAASYGVREDAWWLPALHVRRLLWDQPGRVLGLGRTRRGPPR